MTWVRVCAWLGCIAAWAPPLFAKPEPLPLKRVRLYETGVAYFERSGTLHAGAVNLPVPQSHLDDALKTLVVYSKAGATRVGSVEFGSSVSPSMGRALAGVEPGGGPLGLVALLESLKGANLVLALDSGPVEGRLVDVLDADTSDLERCVRAAADPSHAAGGCELKKIPSLVMLTKTNELRRVALADVRGARPTDAAIGGRLNAALDALSGGSARVLKELRVLAQGQNISLGYVSEAPVWRASYRLVLGEQKNAALQGWALVHNDTDESWHDVTLELVNGRPDSFLFPLAAPRYARRELVTPENELSTVPQLMRTTPDAMWNVDDSEGEGGLGLHGTGEGGGGRGEGIGLGSIGSISHGAGTAENEASALLSVGNLAAVATSEGVESGALFRYTLSDKLDLRAHGSALVPFVGQGIEARRIALFDGEGKSARSAVAITHRGTQTLPAGTLAVFSDAGFAGEAALPRLKPSETTTVEFGADLDVARTHDQDLTSEEPRLLHFVDSELVEHYVLHHRVTEELENRSGEPKSLFLALDYVNNASVTGADEIVYDSQKQHAYAVFGVRQRESVSRTLEVAEGLSRRQSVRVLTSARLLALAGASSLPEAQRALVRRAADELAAAEAKRRSLRAARATLALEEEDATRLREHVRALGAARGTEDLVARVVAAEDRAEATRRSLRALGAEADALGRQATRTLAELGP
jgi:hypothetical protein